MANQRLEPSLQVVSLSTAHVSSTDPVVWQRVISYITSPTDLHNLSVTCRSLYQLAESKLGWSYLIRTKFGHRLWLRYVRQMFHPWNNQQIDLHADIETMEKTEVVRECAKIPATFLLNRPRDEIMPLTRAILRSYRYHLQIDVSKCIVYKASSENVFRPLVSFTNVYIDRLKDAQRRTIPLTKLIYFYLADQRRVSVVNFDIIYSHG
jgi:hypothetical protein